MTGAGSEGWAGAGAELDLACPPGPVSGAREYHSKNIAAAMTTRASTQGQREGGRGGRKPGRGGGRLGAGRLVGGGLAVPGGLLGPGRGLDGLLVLVGLGMVLWVHAVLANVQAPCGASPED